MIKYLIVDDEPIAHRILEKYCNNLPHLQKAGNCYNAFEAMQAITEQPVDLLFLDINMPKFSGLEFLKTMPHPPQVIITSAYQEFALEGYELNVTDYLLKPFSFDRLVKAVNKVVAHHQQTIETPTGKSLNQTSFFLKGDKKHHQVHAQNILFIEAYGNYTKVHLEDTMFVCHKSITAFESLLPSAHFLRVHKSFIVAINHIQQVEGNTITMRQHQLPIGQTYKDTIRLRLNL